MPRLGPISRRKLIEALKQLGFDGPFSGGRHQFMVRGDLRLIVPNPHRGDISEPLLRQLLRQAGISRTDWEQL